MPVPLFAVAALVSALFSVMPGNAAPLDEVRSWGFWLQNIGIEELIASPYELVVIDYSLDGSDAQRFTASQIASIRDSGKIVLAYLSIGEAEKVRFYWRRQWTRGRTLTDSAPLWLDASNPNFPDNFKVRYWMRPWQRVIFGHPSGAKQSYLDQIVEAGFDGVYLDIVDGFEYWKYAKKPKAERKRNAPILMAKFVINLAEYARETLQRPSFLVVPQNGSGILSELTEAWQQRYLESIDGMGAEDTFYFGPRDEDNV